MRAPPGRGVVFYRPKSDPLLILAYCWIFRRGRGVFYLLGFAVNRATAHRFSEVFGRRQYLLVFRHGLSQYQPSRTALAIFEVLQIASAYGRPHAPRGSGLVYVKLLCYGLIRGPLFVRILGQLAYGLDRFADGFRD